MTTDRKFYSETAEIQRYVICPDEDCNERLMINTDDKVVECKNCETMSNISLLKIHVTLDAEDMNRQSVMKELKRQQDKIEKAEKMKKTTIGSTDVRNVSKLNETPIERKKALSDNSSTKPVQSNCNNMGTPKGRKQKKKVFNFTPKKLDMNIGQASDVEKEDIYTKISVVKSDITELKCDAIVNAANVTMLGGGGIDKVIHSKAGKELKNKCRKFPVIAHVDGNDVRCFPGECEITVTDGTKLTNCKYVIHTVGPDCRKVSDMNYNANVLRSCYENCLQSILNPDISIRSLAFCCISTGIFAYPNEDAAKLAWETVVLWLEKNHAVVDKIIFCTYRSKDYDIYLKLLSKENSKSDNLNLLDLQESKFYNKSSDDEKVSQPVDDD